jgi:two-component system, NarL family, nitrate/nitrite response regulator NarL
VTAARARLLLVDDHPLFRAGVRELLDHDGRFVVFGEAGTTSAAIVVAKATSFDAALVDVVVPEDGGPSFVRVLHAQQPACKILALSMLDEPIRVAQMMRAGATGYALKSDPLESITSGLAEVLSGARYLSPNLARAEVESLLVAAQLPLEQLTARERSVFDLLIRGDTSAEIAVQLEIARSTIETHRRSIMRKLAADSVVDLVRVAIRHGVHVVPRRGDDRGRSARAT